MISFIFDAPSKDDNPTDLKVDVKFQTMSSILSEIGGMMKIIISVATGLFGSCIFNMILKSIA